MQPTIYFSSAGGSSNPKGPRRSNGQRAPAGEDPDRDILELAAAGNRNTAIELLIRRHQRGVYRYCCEALHDVTLAEDIAQQVFIEAHRDLAGFGRRSTVRTWLFAIAHHRVLDASKARRRAKARIELDDTADAPDDSRAAGDRIDDDTLARTLIGCVGKLPESTRHAVVLRYQLEFTFEEMAVIFGEKAGTLQARVQRALKQLRRCIERRAGGAL
jgi:RNA polymerase sigma-70 factor (ECF subfamily)